MPATKPFTKLALDMASLQAHLDSKGLSYGSAAELSTALTQAGYYRILSYMRPLQDTDKRFAPGKSLADVLKLYEFDRQLRLLCLDAIDPIEVGLRAAIVEELAVQCGYGPHFYLDRSQFKSNDGYEGFLKKAREARSPGIKHYRDTYSSPPEPPIWSILEAVTLGTTSHLFANVSLANRKKVASAFGYDERVLTTWFRSINVLRNTCAHQSRLWNSSSFAAYPPILANSLSSVFSAADSFHTRAVIMAALHKSIGVEIGWKGRLIALLSTAPERLGEMGFPAGWEAHAFWN